MKIAVLLSGQMRGWKIAAESQRHFWTAPHNMNHSVDFFTHTYDYSQDRTGVSKPYDYRTISEEEHQEMIEFYKPINSVMESKKSSDFYSSDHWCSLFYSFVQSLKLKMKYEIENDFKYDLVVKSRFDLVFDPTFFFHLPYIMDNVIYTTQGGPMETEHNIFNIGDIVFYGKSLAMDNLINIYAYRNFLIRKYDSKSGLYTKKQSGVHRLGPGTLMHEYFRDYGITPSVWSRWQETIIKKGHPENLDLFLKEDFDKMEKYFRDWYEN